MIRKLQGFGAKINAVDNGGNTIFHDAVLSPESSRHRSRESNPPTLTACLQLNLDFSAVNALGNTALHLAALRPLDKVWDFDFADVGRLDFLMQPELGIDIGARNYQGLTALHMAATMSEARVWKLVNAGADISATTPNGSTALHIAAQHGRSNCVGVLYELYLSKSLDINPSDNKGQTPLHAAVISRDLEAVKFLLKASADPQRQDHLGCTPLGLAIKAASSHTLNSQNNITSPNIVEEFVHGASPTCADTIQPTDDSGTTLYPLRSEDNEHAVAILKLLVEVCKDVPEQALQLLRSIHTEIAASPVIDSNKSPNIGPTLKRPNSESQYGEDDEEERIEEIATAVKKRDLSLFQKLLQHSSDAVAVIDKDGLSVSQIVAKIGSVPMMKALRPFINDINGFTPPLLYVACLRKECNLEMLELLLSFGANPNQLYTDERNGWFDMPVLIRGSHSVLHLLANGYFWWHASALSLLSHTRCNFDLSNSEGETALQIASRSDRQSKDKKPFWRNLCRESLYSIQRGAENATIPKQDTTTKEQQELVRAIYEEDVDKISSMLEAGIDPNTMVEYNEQLVLPLQAAADAWEESLLQECPNAQVPVIMELLLNHGADPHKEVKAKFRSAARSYESTIMTTVLHYACESNAPIKPFLKANIDLEARDAEGRTPLIAASMWYGYISQGGREQFGVDLIDAGANVNATNNDGETALHIQLQGEFYNQELLDSLLRAGATASVKDTQGNDPLYFALRHQYEEIEEKVGLLPRLIDAGADPLAEMRSEWHDNASGETVLHVLAADMAKFCCQDDSTGVHQYSSDCLFAQFKTVYERCVEAGCNREARDKKGNTPMHSFAMHFGGGSCAGTYHTAERTILKRDRYIDFIAKHDINALNDDGNGLLHLLAGNEDNATNADRVLLFRLLVDVGLDPRQENKSGNSPLDLAVARDKRQILELFEEKDN